MKIDRTHQLRPGMRVAVEVTDYDMRWQQGGMQNASPIQLPTEVKLATVEAAKFHRNRLYIRIDGDTTSSGPLKNMRVKGYVSAPYGGSSWNGRWFWKTCKLLTIQ